MGKLYGPRHGDSITWFTLNNLGRFGDHLLAGNNRLSLENAHFIMLMLGSLGPGFAEEWVKTHSF
jgi:hypothetical protein